MIGDRLGFYQAFFIVFYPSSTPTPYRFISRNVVKNVIKSILMYNDVDFMPSLRRKDEQKEKDTMSLQSQIRV